MMTHFTCVKRRVSTCTGNIQYDVAETIGHNIQ